MLTPTLIAIGVLFAATGLTVADDKDDLDNKIFISKVPKGHTTKIGQFFLPQADSDDDEEETVRYMDLPDPQEDPETGMINYPTSIENLIKTAKKVTNKKNTKPT